MDLNTLRKIQKIAIIALFSDDDFLDKFILKGGTALDIIYNITNRPSKDIDISMEDDIDISELDKYQKKFETVFLKTFSMYKYKIFDFLFKKKPEIKNESQPDFWGGYEITFKVTTEELYNKYLNDSQLLRVTAMPLGKGSKIPFKIDISKYEYCKPKTQVDLDNYTIYVYSPELIIIEKIRALCQQMSEYSERFGKHYQTPRARDFYDIYLVSQRYKIDLSSEENKSIIKSVFKSKDVPLGLIKNLIHYKNYHERDFSSLMATVPEKEKIESFDFYFEYVINLCKDLESLGDE